MITTEDSTRLIANGFQSAKAKTEFKGKSKDQIKTFLKGITDIEKLSSYADHEIEEEAMHQLVKTKFPKPIKRYRLWWENFNLSIEETYFWVLNYMRTYLGMTEVIKTEDVFSASENSAFFGVSQQRIGLQQDKVSQFMATIGKMVKELFQLVRELRIIDERLDYYKDANHPDRKRAQSAEITLKGIYIDMVEQGAKNPASIYGMARELQFATLPDLFFGITPKTANEVDKEVDKLEFNEMVKKVLKRKLYSFLKWKEKTETELASRRVFTIKFLNQHWESIKLYMNWVRPYLRHIKRLTMDEKSTRTPDLISAFEGSIIDIELLGIVLPTTGGRPGPSGGGNKNIYTAILTSFSYKTRPSMSYQQEGYNRGPIHVGRMEMDIRGYSWSREQINNYLKIKDDEDIELMKALSASVEAAMESLGDELKNYLDEARENKKEEYSKKSTFGSPVKGASELLSSIFTGKKSEQMPDYEKKQEESTAKSAAKYMMYETYKNFKKEHGLLSW